MGFAVWTEDEAGPYGTHPYPTGSWQPQGEALKQSHEYLPNGTAKILTLFHPADGRVRVKGVEAAPNLTFTAKSSIPEKTAIVASGIMSG